MSTPSSYNGWTNQATWLATLWLNGDPASRQVLLYAREVKGSVGTQADALRDRLSQQLESEIEPPCLWRDLLHLAFSQINWEEIIEED